MPGGLHPHAHADSSLLQIAIESFRFSITVVQSPFAALTSFLIQKRDLLKARVIIYAYNQHVWLLSPEPLVVDKPQSTRVEGSQHCYEIRSVPLGKYCRNNPLVFSFEPRCQGLCGSQK